MKVRLGRTLACLMIASALIGAAHSAETFPDRPITLIVPFAAGGPNDVLGRIVADHMAKVLGQSIIIENVSGAGGTIGSARASKSAPDGYTMVSGNLGSHGASYTYYPKLNYEPDSFVGIGMVAGTPNFIAIRKTLPFNTMTDFVGELRANPDKYTAGHAGNGSNGNLVCLLFMATANVKMQLVPYRGSGPAINDLISGQIDAMCDSAPTIVPQAQASTIKALTVAQSSRLAALPDVPTSSEAGFANFEVVGWNAFFVPNGTPASIVAKLNAALLDALRNESVRNRIKEIGAIVPPDEQQSPAWLDTFVRAEIVKWRDVVKNADAVVKP